MFAAILGASLLGNMLGGKGVVRGGDRVISAGEGTNRIQAYDSIICRYFCIWFIHVTLESKSLFEYIKLFSPNEYEMNDKIILKFFQYILKRLK